MAPEAGPNKALLIAAGAFLFALGLWSVFGFLASYEPVEQGLALRARAIWGAILAVCVAGELFVVRAFRRAPRARLRSGARRR